MKILVQFRILRWWRWLRAINKLIGQYLDDKYRAGNCPLCNTIIRANCKDCLWLKFEGRKCIDLPGFEDDYKDRIKRLRRWKYRMLWGKKAYNKKYDFFGELK